MMKNKELFDIVIIASYNEAEDLYSYTKDSWNLLSRYIKDMEMSVDYNDDNKDAMADDVFIPVNTQIDVYLKNIKDLFLCLQLEQAKYYLDIIYKAIENGNLEVEDAQKIDILAIYSFVTVYNGEEKMAYLYCKKMSDIEYLRHDKERLIEYYYIAALVNLQSGQKDLAISSIEEGMKLTSDTNNNKYNVKINGREAQYIPLMKRTRKIKIITNIDIQFEKEAKKNTQLGDKGENIVVEYEKNRLINEGREDLAKKVMTTKDFAGNAEKFDILSYEKDGTERYIEVKTTTGGLSCQFHISEKEVEFSNEFGSQYYLYRVYNVNKVPCIKIMPGPIDRNVLMPSEYVGVIGEEE